MFLRKQRSHYILTLDHIKTNQIKTAVELFVELWNRHDQFDADDDVFSFVISAGVFLAVHDRLLDDGIPEVDCEEIFITVETHEDHLTPAAAVLFDRLSTGETDTTPEELLEEAENKEEQLPKFDLQAAAVLLDALDSE